MPTHKRESWKQPGTTTKKIQHTKMMRTHVQINSQTSSETRDCMVTYPAACRCERAITECSSKILLEWSLSTLQLACQVRPSALSACSARPACSPLNSRRLTAKRRRTREWKTVTSRLWWALDLSQRGAGISVRRRRSCAKAFLHVWWLATLSHRNWDISFGFTICSVLNCILHRELLDMSNLSPKKILALKTLFHDLLLVVKNGFTHLHW